MQAGRVGFATAVCAGWAILLAGCGATTGGQSVPATTMKSDPGRSAAVGAMAPGGITAPAGSIAPGSPVIPSPTASLRPRPKFRNVTVSGVARDTDGSPYRHVVVGFRRSSCPACAPLTVATDDHGGYAVSVPMDTYVIACVAGTHVCTVGGSEDFTDTVTVRGAIRLDLSVQVDGRATAPPPTGRTAVYGRVVTGAGLPVPHATILLVRTPAGGQVQYGEQASADTVADGSYRLAVDTGVHLVACITSEPDQRCGPAGGHGDPFPVTVGVGSQRIDFVLCRAEDYPGCLAR